MSVMSAKEKGLGERGGGGGSRFCRAVKFEQGAGWLHYHSRAGFMPLLPGGLGATFLDGSLQRKSINFGTNTSWRGGGGQVQALEVGKA